MDVNAAGFLGRDDGAGQRSLPRPNEEVTNFMKLFAIGIGPKNAFGLNSVPGR
jgi:hypothetical protein